MVAQSLVALIPQTTTVFSEPYGQFTLEKHKVIRQGKPRWEKRLWEELPDGSRRERRLGAWSLSIPVTLSPLPPKPKKKGDNSEPEEKPLTPEETALKWLENLRWLWNEALGNLVQFDSCHRYSTTTKQFHPCCPAVLPSIDADGMPIRVPITERSYSWVDVSETATPREDCFVVFGKKKLDNGKTIEDRRQGVLKTPYSPPKLKAKRAKWRPSCPIILPRPETFPINGISDVDLCKAFAQKRYMERFPDHTWFEKLPVQPIRVMLKRLAKAWGSGRYHKSGTRLVGRPRFKSSRRGDRIASLTFDDCAALSTKRAPNGLLQSILLPKLGYANIPAKYARRWGNLPIATVTLVDGGQSGWYLSLTTTQKVLPLLKTDKRTALVEIIGKDGVVCTFNGKQRFLRWAKYEALQTQINALKSQRTRQKDTAKRLKDEPTYKGTRLATTVTKLRHTERRLRLGARNEIVKMASQAVQMGGNLSVADTSTATDPTVTTTAVTVKGVTVQIRSLERRLTQVVDSRSALKPAPRPDDPAVANWKPNGASAAKERNREKMQHRTGLFVQKLQEKSDEFGRTLSTHKAEPEVRERQKQKQKQKQRQLVR